jgi:hypothetical protein
MRSLKTKLSCRGLRMVRLRMLLPMLALALAACGGSSRQIDLPYESCSPNDGCTQGTGCIQTSLPASAGFTGSSCSTGCNVDSDCLQDLQNFEAICVFSQCYIQCPQGNSTCPYGTGCVSFLDQQNFETDLCTP